MSCLTALEKLIEKVTLSEITFNDVECSSTCCVCPRPSVARKEKAQDKAAVKRSREQRKKATTDKKSDQDHFIRLPDHKNPPALTRSQSI